VFELTGRTTKIEHFISIMMELGLIEVSRTGIAAISRGPTARGAGAPTSRNGHDPAATKAILYS
jgi:hypothetical protein